jgi:hypothetical protein
MDPESGTSTLISQGCRRCINRRSTEFFSDLLTKNLLCEAVLRLEDSGNFPVHKFILSICSEYFMTLFTTPLHCTQKTDVTLSGVTSETMSLILEYAYTRSVDISIHYWCLLTICVCQAFLNCAVTSSRACSPLRTVSASCVSQGTTPPALKKRTLLLDEQLWDSITAK